MFKSDQAYRETQRLQYPINVQGNVSTVWNLYFLILPAIDPYFIIVRGTVRNKRGIYF